MARPKRIELKPSPGFWTDHAKDHFFAPNLSKLTRNGLTHLELHGIDVNTWLPDFALSSTLVYRVKSPQRQLLWAFIRRVQGAALEYQAASEALAEFFSRKQVVGLTIYFRALLHLELCTALTYQAWTVARRLVPGNPKLFDKGDDSEFERLNSLYNTWKHLDGLISEKRYRAEGTLLVWITNDGLESADRKLLFSELRDMLGSLARLVEHVVHPPRTPAAAG